MAETLGFRATTILTWARAGLLSPQRDGAGALVFSFPDVALLRAVRTLLDADVPARRVRRTLETLRAQLPAGRPLSAVQLDVLGGQILVRDEGRTWEPDSGQIRLELEETRVPREGGVEPVRFPSPQARGQGAFGSADDWYDRAVSLESEDPAAAQEAYRKALSLDPHHADAHLNLGRLLHESGSVAEAEEHYRNAAAADPSSSRALYNLGVALDDQGCRAGAMDAYRAALRLENGLAAAHFNLSRLCEAEGLAEEALRHLAEYKRILDRDA